MNEATAGTTRSRRSSRWLMTLAASLAGALVWLALRPAQHELDDVTDARIGTLVDFRLTGQRGIFSLASLRGRLTLVYFGYTSCPDICPTSLAATGAGLSRLAPDELSRVEMVFVSLDPERDKEPRLSEYASYFHPKIRGLTGTPAEITEAASRFGVVYRKVTPPGASDYVVDHSALTYVVGPDGRLLAELPHGAPPDQVVEVVRRHLPR